MALHQGNSKRQACRTRRAFIDVDLCKVLYRFLCNIISERYEEFYQEDVDTISAGVLAVLNNDSLILDSFLDRVTNKALSEASGQEILSSALIENLVLLVVKKAVIAAVCGALIKFLAVYVSIANGGSSIMWLVIPLLVMNMGYKIALFPGTGGERDRKELTQRAQQTNSKETSVYTVCRKKSGGHRGRGSKDMRKKRSKAAVSDRLAGMRLNSQSRGPKHASGESEIVKDRVQLRKKIEEWAKEEKKCSWRE
ncbi:hypothetical protein MMC07_002089 [Pseudocyphellaria aurata]|nr:hypothetical protein [Pseudocyphellaria aurata]